ncbi:MULTISPECIES: thrombospondin type 3 repeat-containing protein [Hydrocarboniphaga]|uniref:Lipoprotein n=1 Tax=Hydrocarboniphaga effusa AP103 TaxID=1172194 RepID=I8I3D1_9GAMM|nr:MULTISPECIES: thrombospondin type 3 repeat-containing protein [Hydrocarboniphaga]EIT70506.1 hypothetical protein WQQ_06430 [Hydrocarboniphaga effusa AP103]MDZ4078413.1 thrombospondin type 3 repeat-containing protein [Hydrocarboniphaga sp.]
MKHNSWLLALVSASFLLSACGKDGNVFLPDGDGTGGGGTPPPTQTDADGDGIPDATDNCPNTANPDQADSNNNDIGDACDTDEEVPTGSFVSCVGTVCTLSGDINENFTMSSRYQWLIEGVVRVGRGNDQVASQADVDTLRSTGVTLTIDPGVSVGASANGVLLVTRGSKLIADGRADAPITFSSSVDADFDGEGEWGGIIIQGFAPQYGKGNNGPCYGTTTFCNVAGEGGNFVGRYGGNDPADNSGILRYVRIAEGGLIPAGSTNSEVNGLTLMGVGHGTTIDYVQVHSNLDDGIEWFGGTVNATHLVLTNNDDDDIDYDEGYQGNIQYAIVQKHPTKATPSGQNDPRAIEANSSNADYVPQTNAVLANLTLVGGPAVNTGSGQPGAMFRGAVSTALYNSSIKGFNAGCVRIDDATIPGGTAQSNVTLTNVLADCSTGLYANSRQANNAVNATPTTVTLSPSYAMTDSTATLPEATAITAVDNGSGFTFEPTNYVGAVAPGTDASVAWWAGWTLPGTLLTAPAETPAAAPFVTCVNSVCTVTGTINRDYVFTAGVEWVLNGAVRVGTGNLTIGSAADVAAVRAAGVTLTIRPGVSVRGSSDGVLLVTRGSKLIANGRADAPITFSSAADNDLDGEGEWGGVIIQGFAPQYGKGNSGPCHGAGTVCNVQGEGGNFVGYYGGSDPADNSGILRYVRIAEGGLIPAGTVNNEVNGLTLMGVGHGTTIDYVQVHSNLDDAVEWFGGTVNAKHLVLTSNDDDDIDYDEGYQGNIQFAIVRKHPTKATPTGQNDPRAIEANSSNADYVPQTNAVLANLTLIGGPAANSGNGQPGMLFRGAVQTSVYNSAVKGFNVGCTRIDDATVSGATTASNISLINLLGDCSSGLFTGNSRPASASDNATATTVTLDSSMAMTEATANLTTAPTITPVPTGSNFDFEQTDYVGAVKPGTRTVNAWWQGWTIPNTVVP